MGQRRFGGIEGKVAFHKEMKATHEERKKADKKDDKKATTPTPAELATAAGKRRNERAKRLAAERAREAAAKAKKKPTTFKQRMKARGLAAVTREQLAAWEKQTGKKGLRAYLNAKGKLPEVKEVVSPVKRGPPSGRGEVDPLLEIDLSNRTGFKALGKRKTAPSPTARRATEEGRRRNLIQQALAPPAPTVPLTAAQLATARGQRATARSNRLAPPAPPPAPPVPLTAAQRAAAEGRRRNLIQQASAQGFSKGGVIKKSKTRKKSNIDGIARRGHTRAPHK